MLKFTNQFCLKPVQPCDSIFGHKGLSKTKEEYPLSQVILSKRRDVDGIGTRVFYYINPKHSEFSASLVYPKNQTQLPSHDQHKKFNFSETAGSAHSRENLHRTKSGKVTHRYQPLFFQMFALSNQSDANEKEHEHIPTP